MRKSWKSVSIYEDLYDAIKDKHTELIKKNDGRYINVGDVASLAVIVGIDNVTLEDLLK